MGSFRPVRKLLEPYTEFLRFIPSVAMITVAVIWFGIGEASKIFLIIYTTIFIVILNTAAGVSAIAPNKIRAAQSLGATRAQIFFHVALPATVPYILTGMRLAMANSFTTIVAAELIAANDGLGKMLWDGRLFMLVDEIFVSLVTPGAARASPWTACSAGASTRSRASTRRRPERDRQRRATIMLRRGARDACSC